MRAIQILAPRRAEVVDAAIPDIREDEVLVQVEACVTCPHWDISLFAGIDIFERPGYPKYPIPVGFPGHEMAGRVVKAGRGVRSLREGDRVATLVTAGENRPGFYCEYINRPEEEVAKVPDSISFEAAASMEMARSVSPNVRWLGDVKGKRVGVVGLGAAGLIALQMLRALEPSELVAMDVLPGRLELGRSLGATETLDVSRPAALGTPGKTRFQACIDCSGSAAGLQLALDNTAGPVSVFGVIHGEAKLTIRHWFSGVSIVTALDMTHEDTQLVLRLWEEGRLDTGALVGARLPFKRYAEAVGLLMEKRVHKVCMYPG